MEKTVKIRGKNRRVRVLPNGMYRFLPSVSTPPKSRTPRRVVKTKTMAKKKFSRRGSSSGGLLMKAGKGLVAGLLVGMVLPQAGDLGRAAAGFFAGGPAGAAAGYLQPQITSKLGVSGMAGASSTGAGVP